MFLDYGLNSHDPNVLKNVESYRCRILADEDAVVKNMVNEGTLTVKDVSFANVK